jgi:hypothetical protein
VNEFLNVLVDKMEKDLEKSHDQKDMLKELIGGTLSHQIVSLENAFPYFSEREEVYFSISLEIKKKKNI